MSVITWEKIKEQPVSIGTFIVGALVAYWLYTWLGVTFMTKVEAAEYNEQVTAQVAGNTKLLTGLTKMVMVGAAQNRIDSLDAKIDRLKEAGVDVKTIEEADDELRTAGEYKDCLMKNETDCQFLRN